MRCYPHRRSLPTILRRVAYPVEPFGFKFVQNDLPAPLLDGIDGRLGKQPGLFDDADDGHANEFQCVHKLMSRFSLKSAQSAATWQASEPAITDFDSAHQTRLGFTSSNTIPPTSASAPTTGGIKWLSVV